MALLLAAGCASRSVSPAVAPPDDPTAPPVDAGAPPEDDATAEEPAAPVEAGTVDAAPPSPAVPLKRFSADDARFQLTGRVDVTTRKEPRFSAPGVYVRAKVSATAISVMLDDQFMNKRNYYDVLVDDRPPFKITPARGKTVYPVVSGLPRGPHTVTVVKRTEAATGRGTFLGLQVDGELLDPDPRPTRRIELIGDSITAGAGIEAPLNSPKCQEDGWGQPSNAATFAYGPVAARALGADYMLTAVSGIGLVRNYDWTYDTRTMPEVYELTFPEMKSGSPKWDFTRFVPDVVVVALGTNDFSPGDPEDGPRPFMTVDTFATAYEAFVARLRALHPAAVLVLASSPMLSDGYPEGQPSATNQVAAIRRVVAARNAAGDANVHALEVTRQRGEGCGTHPSVAQQAATARELEAFLKRVMRW